MELLAFQRRFLAEAFKPDIQTACLSLPRGNGKSTLAGIVAAKVLKTVQPGNEIALVSGSIEQSRIVFRVVRSVLGEGPDWKYLDSSTRCGITRADGARLRIVSSNPKTAMGLLRVPLVVLDEPGSWEVRAGQLMYDAISTAQGKPGSPLRAIYVGTLAPSLSGWWHDLVAKGSGPGTHVTVLQGDRKRWSDLRHVYSVNPLARSYPELRRTLRLERDQALADSRLKARFLSYRMNVPSADESEVLLTLESWQTALQRPVAERQGKPIVGIDLGAGRSWSAAVALWETGRVEAVALAPGVPSLSEQEKRDLVPSGLYQRLHASGRLDVCEGLHVPPPRALIEMILHHWNCPALIVCDRFRLHDLLDAKPPCPVEPRVTRWSEASSDIRALRKLVLDGGLSVETSSRPLISASLAVSKVKSDDAGNVRLVKADSNGKSRDDVCAALLLAAGEHERRSKRPKRRWRLHGIVG